MYLLLAVPIIGAIALPGLFVRNQKLSRFRMHIINAEVDLLMTDSELLSKSGGDLLIYRSLPGYYSMVLSFWKPLRYSYWLSKEDLELLKPYLIENI